MSELEEQLLGSEDEEEAPKPKRENSTIRQMREALEAKTAEAEEARVRAMHYETIFLQKEGLSEKQAAVLKAGGYEATPEGIAAFRAEVLGAVSSAPAEEPQEVSQDEEVEEEEPKAPFQPTQGGIAPPSKREVTSEELLELMRSDPIKADKLLREGRVQRQQFNPGGPAF